MSPQLNKAQAFVEGGEEVDLDPVRQLLSVESGFSTRASTVGHRFHQRQGAGISFFLGRLF